MRAGERCQAPRNICTVSGPHSHCDCGLAIEIGGGFCEMCLRELMRGAHMGRGDVERPAASSRDEKHSYATKGDTPFPVTLSLPAGHTTWQTTPYCRHGHLMTPENILWVNNHKYRTCRACRRISNKATDARLRRTRSVPPELHGTKSAYGRYGCRCAVCRNFKAQDDRARKLRRRQERQEAA